MAGTHAGGLHLTLDQGLGVAELASSVRRLIILQELTNNYLANHAQDIQKAQPSWSDLANEVGQETAQLALLARRNRKAVLGKPKALEATFTSALANAQLDDATKHKISAGIDAAGGIVAYVTSSLDSLDRDLPAQRESFFALADQMSSPATDQAHGEALVNTAMRLMIVCGLYGAATGAAAATGNVFGVIMAVAAATNAGCFG